MIYAAKATDLGKQELSTYDGSNNGNINFFEAALLTFCQNSYVPMRGIVSAVNKDYPFTMNANGISDGLVRLERKGFVTLQREVDETTSLLFAVKAGPRNIWFVSNWRTFLGSNPSFASDLIRNRIFKELRLKGVASIDATLMVKLH